MKKITLIVLALIASTFVKAQGSAEKIRMQNFTLFTSAIVDTTLRNIDTSYSVVNNVVYRTISTIFQEDNKEKNWDIVKCKTKYTNRQGWIFYSASIEPYARPIYSGYSSAGFMSGGTLILPEHYQLSSPDYGNYLITPTGKLGVGTIYLDKKEIGVKTFTKKEKTSVGRRKHFFLIPTGKMKIGSHTLTDKKKK